MTTIIVIPTYNEAENVLVLAGEIARRLPDASLLIVDDNSPDGTADLAEQAFCARSEFRAYRVLRRSGPRGLGRAYRDGFMLAFREGFDRIVQMDADLSHDPASLPSLLEATATADLVIGSRYCPGGAVQNWAWHRILLSRFAVWYVHTVTGIPVRDVTAGYRCWTRRALEAVQIESLTSEGYAFQVEMSHRAWLAGMRMAEVPITFTDRRMGRSKISRSVLWESCVLPWRLRRSLWRPAPLAPVGGDG